MKKKFLMAAMTATIALGCAFTSFAAEPVYFNDFESGADDATIVGSGAIETAEDENFGKVFHNNVTGDTTLRSNYLVLPEGVLGHSVESKQLTIQFWVNKGTAKDYFFAPIFSAYEKKNENNTHPMFILQSRLLAQVNCAGYTDYTKVDCKLGLGEDGEIIADTSWLDDEKWHLYTAVLDNTSLKIYIDGKNVRYWESDGTDAHNQSGLFSNGADLKYVCLGGNQAWDWKDADAAYMFDDVAIYNVALSNADIQAIIDEKTAKEDPTEPSTGEKPTEPSTGEKPTEPANPSPKPTEPANPSPKPEDPTTGSSVTDVTDFGVTDEEVKAMKSESKLEGAEAAGLPKDTEIRVATIGKAHLNYKEVVDFLGTTLKGKKAIAVDLSLMLPDGAAVDKKPSGKVKVTLPVSGDIAKATWIQVYRYDNTKEKFVEVDKVEVKDGKFTFETDHFTPYVFESVDAPKPDTTKEPTTTGKTVTDNGKKPNTGDSAPIAVFAGMAAAGLAVFAVSKKRKNA